MDFIGFGKEKRRRGRRRENHQARPPARVPDELTGNEETLERERGKDCWMLVP